MGAVPFSSPRSWAGFALVPGTQRCVRRQQARCAGRAALPGMGLSFGAGRLSVAEPSWRCRGAAWGAAGCPAQP